MLFDNLGRWTKVLDGRTGEFAVLSAILCGPQLKQNWIPTLLAPMVEGEGSTTELIFIPHDWEEWGLRGNMVRGAILNTSFHKKSKGAS